MLAVDYGIFCCLESHFKARFGCTYIFNLSLRKMVHANEEISNWIGFCDHKLPLGVKWADESQATKKNFLHLTRFWSLNLYARQKASLKLKWKYQFEWKFPSTCPSGRPSTYQDIPRRKCFFFPLQEFSIIKGLILLFALVIISTIFFSVSKGIFLPGHLSLSINFSHV